MAAARLILFFRHKLQYLTLPADYTNKHAGDGPCYARNKT